MKKVHWVVILLVVLMQACFEGDGAISKIQAVEPINESGQQPVGDERLALNTSATEAADIAVKNKVSQLNLCEGLPDHKDRVVLPKMAKPSFAETYRDPVFGGRVTRISNARVGEVVKPAYSTMQAWNADESLLMLYHTGSDNSTRGHHLYDGKTYQYLRKLDIVAKDVEEVFWHHENPDIFYYVSVYYKYNGQFIEYNVRSGKRKVLASFDNYCGRDGVPVAGNSVMMQTWDDDLFGFRCDDGAGQMTAFNYRVSTGKTHAIPLGDGTPYLPWTAPMPGPSGQFFFLNEYLLDETLTKQLHRLDLAEYHSHASIGKLANGHDALFAAAYDPAPKGCDGGKDLGVGSLVVHDFNEKTCRVIVGESNGYGYPGSGVHVSAVAHRAPGWTVLTTVGYGKFEYLSNQQKAPILFSEVYLVNTDPDNTQICRVAHHRTHGKDAEGTSYNTYFGEPHASLSPSGTRIVFGSDWQGSGSVDTYIIELPVYQN